ncbi:MAG TPA: glycosyltransferase [Mycobacteriales bacterium]|nr:glycosyltransferase [Mycobacteriales bacterium]
MTELLTSLDVEGAPGDPRLAPPAWNAAAEPRRRSVTRLIVVVQVLAAVWYFGWLLTPARIGDPLLYGPLIAAELFNLVQAAGFCWTVVKRPRWVVPRELPRTVDVDVLIPVYGESVEVVEPTVAASGRLRGARVHVYLLDDGNDPAMQQLADRNGATCIRRPHHTGAKAGNINHALQDTASEFVLVLDCDHVPRPELLERTLGEFTDPKVALVQTPQYYANTADSPVAAAAWAQQSLFFGSIARGKDALGAMFCGGTNVVLRRTALSDAGDFPEDSLTEDFELSVKLHERNWRTVYVPEVLACGLGPTDMGSYVGQQLRWSRGCLSAIGTILRARLPIRLRLQYLLSSMYFLSGWTLLIYMSLPVTRMLTGEQPLATAGADQFLVHFAPYFGLSLLIVARAGQGCYSFGGFALAATSWWVHVVSSVRAVLRRPGRFVVTPKHAGSGWQPKAVLPSLIAVAILLGSSGYVLASSRSPSTLNNVGFALLHVTVLLCGAAPALRLAHRVRRQPLTKEIRVDEVSHDATLDS